MSAYFCDSSAIVKRYVVETGSDWILAVTDPAVGNRIYVARITLVEVVSAISRRERGGHILAADADKSRANFEKDFSIQFRKVEITEDLAEIAAQLAKNYNLRGYDAVQLSAALETEKERISSGLSPLTLLSADIDLNAAAENEGLAVDDPNDH